MESRAKDLEARSVQEREENALQMQLVKEMLTGERQRREETLERLREEAEVREKGLKDRAERLESESRDFFGRTEAFLEEGVGRVREEVSRFRQQSMAESEKVADLVRKEIEARFSSDV